VSTRARHWSAAILVSLAACVLVSFDLTDVRWRAWWDVHALTTDTATQHQIVDQLQQVVLSDVPFIPITEEVGWFQYNTADFTGWPSPSDPYALPAAYAYPDMGQVLLHLSPK